MQTKSALKVKQHFLDHFFGSKILLWSCIEEQNASSYGCTKSRYTRINPVSSVLY